MKQPLVAPLLALAAGIAAARVTPFTLWETLFSVTLLIALAAVSLRLRAGIAGAASCLAGFLLAGALLGSLPRGANSSVAPPLITTILERTPLDTGDPVRLRGWVREPPEDLGDADRFVLQAESVFRDTPARGGIRVTVNRSPGMPPVRLAYGQRLEFLTRVRLPRNFENPGAFDWEGYLERRGIFLTASVRPGVPLFSPPGRRGSWVESQLWRTRLWARGRLSVLLRGRERGDPDTHLSSTTAGIVSALLLGDRHSLDPQTTTEFQKTGAYHVLVVSGLHVGLLAFVLLRLLRLLFVPVGVAAGLTVVAASAYALLAGAGVPVMRATWMLTAYLVAALVFRQRQALNVIAGAALCFLVADPELLFDAGFQLSFLAVAVIAGIAVPSLETTLEPVRLALRDIWNTDRDLHLSPTVAERRVAMRTWLEPMVALSGLRRGWVTYPFVGVAWLAIWAAELAWVSLVVQAGLALPLAVHFQRVSAGAVFANLAIVPLVTVAIPAGLLALLTGWSAAAAVSLSAAEGIGRAVSWQALHWPMDFRVPPPPFWLAALFGLSLAAVRWSFHGGRWRRLGAAAASIVLLGVLVVHPFPPQIEPGRLEMTAIDVGQGDALFLAFPRGKTMMVDAGGQPDFRDPEQTESLRRPIDIGEAVVSPYLWSRSIQKLDAIAVTHADADHFGGVPALLRNFEVGELWLARDQPPEPYSDVIELARRRGTKVRWLGAGQALDFGGAPIDVLGPSGLAVSGTNNQSMVLRLRYGRHRFLLTADIEQERELAMTASGLVAPSDILKVAHHGSRTSSQQRFLNKASPLFGIISAGADNLYGHPHREALDRLAQQRVNILRTDQRGLITVTSDGWRLAVETFRRQARLNRLAPVSVAPTMSQGEEPGPRGNRMGW